MLRFESLRRASSETRRILRARFRRSLPVAPVAGARVADPAAVSDESALKFLLDVEIETGRDEARARSAYEAVQKEPTADVHRQLDHRKNEQAPRACTAHSRSH